jgi:diazepam-binding inhibitor (GABA receptor modulator, acyl-CoA-binding protein)
MVGRAKYDAWAKLEGVSQKDAEKAYIAKVNALLKA